VGNGWLDLANFRAIHAVGASLVRYLSSVYPADLRAELPFEFKLVASSELNGPDAEFRHTITLYLHRVSVNAQTRNSAVPVPLAEDVVPLSLDLHYLVTVWADSSLEEHTVLGWVMRELQQHQAMSLSDLSPEADWSADDIVQVVPSEMSNEDMMRIWDALDPGYRLSVSYVARVVPIFPAVLPAARPVVVRSFGAGGLESAP